MGELLDVAYNIEYGADTVLQSSLNLIYLLAYQPMPGDFSIFGSSDERYHLHGGNEGLPRAIAEWLAPGTIQTGTSLEAIRKNSNGSYTLRFQRGSTKFNVTADRVILALPFSVLRTLDYNDAGFNTTKTTAIQQLGYGTNAKLHLQFSERVWNQSGPWGISNGSSFSDTSEHVRCHTCASRNNRNSGGFHRRDYRRIIHGRRQQTFCRAFVCAAILESIAPRLPWHRAVLERPGDSRHAIPQSLSAGF